MSLSRSGVRGRARPAREYAPCEPARQTPNRERQTRLGELSLSPRRPPSPRCLLTWRADSTCDCVFRGCLGQLRTWALGSPTVCPCVACASALHMREKARSSNIRCSLNENVMHVACCPPAAFFRERRETPRASGPRARNWHGPRSRGSGSAPKLSRRRRHGVATRGRRRHSSTRTPRGFEFCGAFFAVLAREFPSVVSR